MKLFDLDPPRSLPKREISGVGPLIDSDPTRPILIGLSKIRNEYEEGVKIKAEEYANGAVSAPNAETDEELMEKAKDSIADSFAERKNKLETKTAKELDSLIERKKSAYDDYSDKTRSIDRLHSDKERRAFEALSKNGMTHSTVFDLRKEQLADDHAYDRARLDAKLENEVRNLDGRIEETQRSYRSALASFEIDYALALEDKLQKLTAKRDKILQSFEKSKQSKLGEREREYVENLEKENEEYEKEFRDYTGDKRTNYEKRLNFAVEETKRLPKSQRDRFVRQNEDELRSFLGFYYPKYIKEIGG